MNHSPVIGACICNPGLSKVFFGQYEDDALYSRTLSLLSFITVSEMLLNKVRKKTPYCHATYCYLMLFITI